MLWFYDEAIDKLKVIDEFQYISCYGPIMFRCSRGVKRPVF